MQAEYVEMMLSRLFRKGLSCSEILEVLQSYLDGESSAREALQVSGHLENCDYCEHESLIYQRIKLSLANVRHDVDPEVIEALARYGQRLARGDLA